jgi:dATP pyrophosphohydrolase
MARAPFQVLVYPYLKAGAGRFEYALLKRSDAGYWQAIAGGGEDDETPLEAARREAYEEAGIPGTADFLQLGAIVASAANQLVSLLVANFVDTTIGATI